MSPVMSLFMFGWCIHHFFSYVYLIAMATSKKVLFFYQKLLSLFVETYLMSPSDVSRHNSHGVCVSCNCFLFPVTQSHCWQCPALGLAPSGLCTNLVPLFSCVVACVCLTGSAPQCTEARIFGDYIGAVHGFALLIWSGPHFFMSMQWWQR